MPKKRSHGDGGLYKIRGGALWRATLDYGHDPATGRAYRWEATSRTQKGARDKMDAAREEIAQHGSPIDKKVTVAQWAPAWIATHARDIDPKTRAGYASLISRWIVPTIGPKKIATLKPSDVVAVRTAMAAAGRATSTQKQAHIVMRLMLDAARKDRLCRTNPADDAPMPGARRQAVVKRERGAFTTEQAVAILAAATRLPTPEASRWWFKVLTGARQGEILGATLDDLHIEDAYYVVNWKLEELSREHGCGGTCRFKQGARCPEARWVIPDDFEMRQVDGRWHLTRPKSRTGRVVPLIPQMVEALRRHTVAVADLPNPHGLIWHDGTGRPITPRDDSQEWRDLLHAAGIIGADETRAGGTTMTGHWARHTAVTVLMELTHGDAQLVGGIVGHSSAEVTEMYRHARVEEREAAMAALGQAWSGALGQLESTSTG